MVLLAPSYKLYGVPLSQPFRSVAWTLLLQNIPFDTQLVAPGSPHPKNGSLGDDFRILTGHRSTTTPVLWDRTVDGTSTEGAGEDGFVVLESAAILTYLCHKHSWNDLYPPWAPGSLGRLRATLDSYLHWHHTGTRQLAQLVQPALRPDLPPTESHQARLARARVVLSQLEHGWLGTAGTTKDDNNHNNNGGPFLAGSPHPTIADILCYGEISQAVLLGALNLDQNDDNNNDYHRLRAWSDHMRSLPYHDDVHAALYALGNIGAESETKSANGMSADDESSTAATRGPPLSKRLGRVTRVGLEAIQRAQDSYRTTP